jgi:sulfite reductase alpha subunit-like flavoprotein
MTKNKKLTQKSNKSLFAALDRSVLVSIIMAADGSGDKKPLLILYGSETGNAESISKRIHHDAVALGFQSEWAPMKDFKKV